MKKLSMNYGRAVFAVETPAVICGKNRSKSTIACWDTGSNVTVIANDIARELELEEHAGMTGYNLGGESYYKRYTARINFGNGIVVDGKVLGRDKISKDDRIGIVVGMDIISLGDFKLLSLKGKTEFSFEVDL